MFKVREGQLEKMGLLFERYHRQLLSSGSSVDKKRENGVYRVTVDKSINGTINGGGATMIFKNHNGDIYIRKK
ncbi:MAG: hypothetical protein ACLFUB_15225 [Cyclobacteriaceae bacterium]